LRESRFARASRDESPPGILESACRLRGADIVIIYRGRITGGTLQAADDAEDAGFFAPEQLPPLAFKATRRALETWLLQSSECAEEPKT